MKVIFLILTLTMVSFRTHEKAAVNAWVIEKKSTLSIDGSSNINKFTCEIREYVNPDTLKHVSDPSRNKYIFSDSRLTVDLKSFDCHHKYITADFRKMLKADKYPHIIIHFISLDEFHQQGTVKGLVDIELAGRKKRMEVLYNCTSIGGSQLKLIGERRMKFTDFELQPPSKLGGLIRINEEILVHFNLYFRKIV